MENNDNRIVITLDAGGTNLVFGAMQAGRFITEPVTLPSEAHDLDLCIGNIIRGFESVIERLDERPAAISFAFPGPADYPAGIIGGYLPNFPSFRDGVALGPLLERHFGIPVFINNDGDLFAYGEAMGGMLPEVNRRLAEAGSPKRFGNLLGYTFGTGLGVGMVVDGRLNRGNNSCVETFCLPHMSRPDIMVEEGVSIRAVKRVYAELSGDDTPLEPKDICAIADGQRPGNREAALESFRRFGEVAGDAIATAVTLTDALVVVGGGLTGAARHIMPALLKEMRRTIATLGGDTLTRIPLRVFDLDNEAEMRELLDGDRREIKIYGTDQTVCYDPMKATGVAVSRLGASQAISLGAYLFALNSIR